MESVRKLRAAYVKAFPKRQPGFYEDDAFLEPVEMPEFLQFNKVAEAIELFQSFEINETARIVEQECSAHDPGETGFVLRKVLWDLLVGLPARISRNERCLLMQVVEEAIEEDDGGELVVGGGDIWLRRGGRGGNAKGGAMGRRWEGTGVVWIVLLRVLSCTNTFDEGGDADGDHGRAGAIRVLGVACWWILVLVLG